MERNTGMSEIEWLYYDLEWINAKRFCIEHNRVIDYHGKTFYFIWGNVYDEDRNLIIENAENGFLDLFEYYEYFEPSAI